MKYATIEEFTRAGGIASAKKRFEGKTKEEVSEIMSKLKKGKKKNWREATSSIDSNGQRSGNFLE